MNEYAPSARTNLQFLDYVWWKSSAHTQIMRFDASMESLINTGRSESFVDLADTDLALSRSVLSQSREMLLSYQGKYALVFG